MQCQWGSMKTLIEQAKEELEILEYQQPNKFNSMKKELRAFIFELESQNLPPNHTNSSISAATQESSNINKRKKDVSLIEAGSMKRRCKTDAVLERAQQCLHKIQHLKTSLSWQCSPYPKYHHKIYDTMLRYIR